MGSSLLSQVTWLWLTDLVSLSLHSSSRVMISSSVTVLLVLELTLTPIVGSVLRHSLDWCEHNGVQSWPLGDPQDNTRLSILAFSVQDFGFNSLEVKDW